MLIAGLLMAMVNGVMLPLLFLVYGDMTDSFIGHGSSSPELSELSFTASGVHHIWNDSMGDFILTLFSFNVSYQTSQTYRLTSLYRSKWLSEYVPGLPATTATCMCLKCSLSGVLYTGLFCYNFFLLLTSAFNKTCDMLTWYLCYRLRGSNANGSTVSSGILIRSLHKKIRNLHVTLQKLNPCTCPNLSVRFTFRRLCLRSGSSGY